MSLSGVLLEGVKLSGRAAVLCLCVVAASAAFAEPASKRYEATWQLTGYLLRSARVCGEDLQRTLAVVIKYTENAEMKKIAKNYPLEVNHWQVVGIDLFDKEVMSEGLDLACKFAINVRLEAESE